MPSSALLLTGAIAARLSMKVFADASGTALMRLTTSRKIIVLLMRLTTSRKTDDGVMRLTPSRKTDDDANTNMSLRAKCDNLYGTESGMWRGN